MIAQFKQFDNSPQKDYYDQGYLIKKPVPKYLLIRSYPILRFSASI
jgi:hypothetical protein